MYLFQWRQENKPDDQEPKTIFVGYTHGGYTCCSTKKKEVIESRDIAFIEDGAWRKVVLQNNS